MIFVICVNNFTFRPIFGGLMNVIDGPVYRTHPLVQWSLRCGPMNHLGNAFLKFACLKRYVIQNKRICN